MNRIMELSSDSDDCQLYTRAADNVAMKKKLLDEERKELALRMKCLPADQVQGFSRVFDRLGDSPEPPIVTGVQVTFDSDDEIPLSQLTSPRSGRSKRKAVKTLLPKKKSKRSRNCQTSSRRNRGQTSSGLAQSNNTNEIPTIVFDDDTDYPTSFAPIHFNSHSNKNRTEDANTSIIDLDKLQANYDDENYEDVDTLVKISVDWRNNSGVVGLNLKHFQLRRYQKFETIFEELGKMENLPINRIVIMRNFETIRPRDTPASLNLTYYGHFIGQISKTEVDHNLPKLSELENDFKKLPEEDLKIKLLLDSKTSLFFTISKTQKMDVLYKKCSEELKVSDNKIKISFDGEVVEQQDTVSDLGVEDGDVFHVLIKKG